MDVMVDLCIVPLGEGNSLSKYIAECTRILRRSGLKTTLHGFGTIIEGDWDEVFDSIKQCHLALHNELGVERVTTTIKLGTRTDKVQSAEDKVNAVERLLSKP